MIGAIIIIGILLFILINKQNNIKKNNEMLANSGFSPILKIDAGKYIAGHPRIDNSLKFTAIFPKNNCLYIFEYTDAQFLKRPIERATIQFTSIKNIAIEDASTIEKRLTVGRLLAFGVFAFALKKKQKNELAYLTIEWDDGMFNHETYFEFEGKEAMQKANTARNKLLRIIE